MFFFKVLLFLSLCNAVSVTDLGSLPTDGQIWSEYPVKVFVADNYFND